MYIRTRDDAMDALGAILELPERRSQIVQSTVKVALCMTPEARSFMLDVQAGILSGGLDALRERRQAAVKKLTDTTIRRKAPGIDIKTDPLLEPIGQALDLLKMVDILISTFPGVAARHPKWELARFIHENVSYVREAIEAGLRRRGKPEHAPLEKKVLAKVEEAKPWWPEWAQPLKEACAHYVRLLSKEPGDVQPQSNDPDVSFYIITMSDERAQEVLHLLVGTADKVLAYFRALRARIDLVLTAQARADS
ncbi:MAG TPA: hypothetical protein VF950_23215 [Planctomycetota bacterium]